MTTLMPDGFIEVMAEKFQMLADASRLRILKALMSEEKSVGEIVETTGLSQANVSKHLRLLAKAQLLGRRKAGLKVFYDLRDPIVKRICALICKTILHDLELTRGKLLRSKQGQRKH